MTTQPLAIAPTRLTETLARCKAEGRAALIGYLPACFPTPERGIAALTALVEGGVDAVEVGLPYSDPVLEGPIIARSHDIARRSARPPPRCCALSKRWRQPGWRPWS